MDPTCKMPLGANAPSLPFSPPLSSILIIGFYQGYDTSTCISSSRHSYTLNSL